MTSCSSSILSGGGGGSESVTTRPRLTSLRLREAGSDEKLYPGHIAVFCQEEVDTRLASSYTAMGIPA